MRCRVFFFPAASSIIFAAILQYATTDTARADFRAAWVPTVVNLSFPSRAGLPVEAQKRQIAGIVETARHAGLNALMVQVRPECDAFYRSNLEPWSRYLSGRQGESPGYDPLASFIEEGGKNGIAIHAWINPYRAALNGNVARSQSHITNRLRPYTYRVGRQLWLDPGAPEVQDHVTAVVRDLLKSYPLAGVHLDDYFYPYPDGGYTPSSFPDSKTYSRYRANGGALSLADWRRENVNKMVRRLRDVVKTERPGAVFGVSPFGIYTKGQPSDVRAGLDQLNEIFADPVLWMREGWVDYIAPQLYWREGSAQSYSSLLRWWRSPRVNPRGVPVYPGIALDRLLSHGWPVAEIRKQLSLERLIGPRAYGGFVLFHTGQLVKNSKGIRAIVSP